MRREGHQKHRNTNDRKKSTQKGRQQMKKMKKLVSLALSFVMVIAMAISTSTSVSAAGSAIAEAYSGTDAVQIKVQGAASGHKYRAYPLLVGNVDGSKLASPQWAASEDDVINLINALNDKGGSTGSYFVVASTQEGGESTYMFGGVSSTYTDASAEAMVSTLGEERFDSDSANLKKFAEYVNKYIAGSSSTTGYYEFTEGKDDDGNGTKLYTTGNVQPGYYLIKDEDGSVSGDKGTFTTYMLQVTSSETINVKNTLTPTLTKTDTKDIDGETLKNEAKGVSGQVGDTVYFKLHATLPASIQDYKTYRLVFEDTLPKGLTYAPDTFLKVIIENSGKASDRIVLTKDTDYKVVATPNATDGTTNIKIYIKDLLKDIDVSELQSLQNDKITGSYVIDVKYAATIDSDVVLGENQNKAVLHFNNNPYYEGNGYPGYPDPDDKTDNPEPGPGGDTPEDEASVYTFELDLKKTDSSNKVLPGAKFIIRDANNNYAKTVSEGKVTEWTSTKSDANTFTSDAEGKIVISGLGAGTYYLTETEAPSGYNKLTADKTVTITAGTYTKTTGTDGTVTIAPETLTISVDGGNAADGASNKVAMTVINTTAKELPTTGGMGRTLIYTLGALLAIGAAVQLVVRKRMRVEK